MKSEVRKDWDWSDSYLDQIKSILYKNLKLLVEIEIASKDKDIRESTDIVINVSSTAIAVRLRRSNYAYRDLTIRAKRDSGSETELSKIKHGFARWYLYGWTEKDCIEEWILVDLDELRNSGLLEGNELIPNGDGTYFIAIPYQILRAYGCLVGYRLKELEEGF